ncbi:hypothetical protein ACRAWD_30800 [Caulobacter segnis]
MAKLIRRIGPQHFVAGRRLAVLGRPPRPDFAAAYAAPEPDVLAERKVIDR